MARFFIGLLLGGATVAITWSAGLDTVWAALAGIAVALLVWCADTIATGIDRAIDIVVNLFS